MHRLLARLVDLADGGTGDVLIGGPYPPTREEIVRSGGAIDAGAHVALGHGVYVLAGGGVLLREKRSASQDGDVLSVTHWYRQDRLFSPRIIAAVGWGF